MSRSWWHRAVGRNVPHASSRGKRQRPRVEELEDRLTPVTLTVTSFADSGPNTLRDAITQVNGASGSSNFIHFDLTLPATITLNTPLPDLANSVSIDGPGANSLTVCRNPAAGTPAFSVFTVEANVLATLVGLTVTNGSAADGGGIDNLGYLSLRDARVTVNTATDKGGGIFSNPPPLGAGSVPGGLSIVNSVVDTNTTSGNGGAAGIDVEADSLDLENSTVSGNRSTAGSNAGGIALNGGFASITNSTIAANVATGAGEAGGLNVAPTAASVNDMQDTLLATNLADGTSPDVQGTVFSQGNNLVGDGTGATGLQNGRKGDQVGPVNGQRINPQLDILKNNGGPTPTMALLPGSPAIDHGSNPDSSSALPADQRGLQRVVNKTIDIGAYEFGASLVGVGMSLASSAGNLTVTAGQSFALVASFLPTVTGTTTATPGGTVQFSVDGMDVGSPAGVTNGQAVLALPHGLAAGDHTLTAVYSGDSNFAPTDAASSVTIAPAPPPAPPAPPAPAPPAPPAPLTGDVTARVRTTLASAPKHKKHRSKGVTKTLTLVNTSGSPLQGPLAFVLHGLGSKTRLQGAAGSVGTKKNKSPYVVVNPSGGRLAAGGTVSTTLRFSGKPGHFTLAVFAGTAPQ